VNGDFMTTLDDDEMLMLMAYRRCSPWRRTAIAMMVQALSANDAEPPSGNVIPFPRSDGR